MAKLLQLTRRCFRSIAAAMRPAVEALQLAHEIVEAARRRAELAQGKPQRKARGGGPQQQREMRKVAALDEDADQLGHDFVVPQNSTVMPWEPRACAASRRMAAYAPAAILRGSPLGGEHLRMTASGMASSARRNQAR